MESTPQESAEGMAVVRVLAAVLERLVTANAPLARSDPGQITKFHALKAPGIGILQYLERIHKYASCSTECFILALIYIDRLIQRNNFLLTELNVHRVVITAVLLAAKFFDDAYYNNAYYAKVGGVHVTEMNSLEVEFLFRINFSLHVTLEVFQKYHAELVTHALAAGLGETRSDTTFMQPASCPPQHLTDIHGSFVPSAVAVLQNLCAVETSQSVLGTHVQASCPMTSIPVSSDVLYGDQSQSYYNQTNEYQQHFPQQITPSPPLPSFPDALFPNASSIHDAVNNISAAALFGATDNSLLDGSTLATGIVAANHYSNTFSDCQRLNTISPTAHIPLTTPLELAMSQAKLNAIQNLFASHNVVIPNLQQNHYTGYIPTNVGPVNMLAAHEPEHFYVVDNTAYYNSNSCLPQYQQHLQQQHQPLHHHQHNNLVGNDILSNAVNYHQNLYHHPLIVGNCDPFGPHHSNVSI